MASRSGGHKAKANAGRSKAVRAVRKKSSASADPMSNIHVRLLEPRLVRKKLLATAIESIELLKRFDNYRELQKQKSAVRSELVAVLKEIKALVRQLKSSELPRLPEEGREERIKKSIKEEQEPAPEETEVGEVKARAPKERVAPKLGGIESELEDLKRKLAEI